MWQIRDDFRRRRGIAGPSGMARSLGGGSVVVALEHSGG